MPLQLRLATEADGPILGRIARDAFQDSLSRSLFPPHLNPQPGAGDAGLDEAQWRATRTIRRMKEGKPTFVVVDVPENGSSTEAVVGFAQWELPLQPTSPDGGVSEAAKDPVPQTLDEGKLREMYEIIDIETKRALGPDGHSKMWYLVLLAVDPDQHRRGIGKILMQHGLDLAARDGTDAFLIATPNGRGLYKKVGFSQIGEEFTLGDTPHCSMLWRRSSLVSA